MSIPVEEFKTRITKKTFGQKVSDRFNGIHTGVDVEYDVVLTEISVNSIYDGEIIYSGFVSGYGGLVAEKIIFDDTDYVVIYGHLAPTSLIKNGKKVIEGERLGILGKRFSKETDGERKHLHLGIVKGNKINFLGYVKTEDLLNGWVNPLDFF